MADRSAFDYQTRISNEALNSREEVLAITGESSLDPYKLYLVQYRESNSADNTPLVIVADLPQSIATNTSAEFETPLAGLFSDKARNVQTFTKAQMGFSFLTQDMTLQVWNGSAPWEFTFPMIFSAIDEASFDVTEKLRLLRSMITPDRDAQGILISPAPTIDLGEIIKDFAKPIANTIRATTKNSSGSLAGKSLEFLGDTIGDVSEGATETLDKSMKIATQNLKTFVGAPTSKQYLNSKDKRNRITEQRKQAANKGRPVDLKSPKIRNRISLHIGRFMYLPSVIITNVGDKYNAIFDSRGNPIRAEIEVNFRTMMVPVKYELEEMYPTAPRQAR